MRTKTRAWRKRVLDACQLVAQAVSQTRGGAAHTVQLMMQDPQARDELLASAIATADATQRDQYQKLQAAVDLLRGYAGERL